VGRAADRSSRRGARSVHADSWRDRADPVRFHGAQEMPNGRKSAQGGESGERIAPGYEGAFRAIATRSGAGRASCWGESR